MRQAASLFSGAVHRYIPIQADRAMRIFVLTIAVRSLTRGVTSIDREEPAILLTAQPAGKAEKRAAVAAALATALVFLALAPFADVPMPRAPLFLGVYQPALIVCDIVTAVFLYGRFSIGGPRPLLVLASGYMFSATMAAFHGLTFPGLFSATGLLGAGQQTTAWIYFLWHLGFPGAVIAYALISDPPGVPRDAASRRAGFQILAAIAAAITLAVVLMLVTTRGEAALPLIMRGDEDRPAKYVIAWITWLVTLSALPALWRRGKLSVLDLWLMVVVVAWLFDIAQSAVFNSGRYSLGWYAGRSYGLLASTFLLAALILEDSKLYGRLIRSHAAARLERRRAEQKTTELDALNASLEERVKTRTAELERSNAELRRAQAEVHEFAVLGATAREQERAHLARELHDDLNQALIILSNELRSLRKRNAADALTDSKLAGMEQLIDSTLVAVKRIETNLRPAVLDLLGLGAAVKWLADQFREREQIECELAVSPPDVELAEPYSTAIFRIVQEALTNIGKHANASHVEVALRCAKDAVRLHISDDGVGFDTDAPRKAESFGLAAMRERVHLVSGRITIDSAPGQGTRIEVLVPLNGAGSPEKSSD